MCKKRLRRVIKTGLQNQVEKNQEDIPAKKPNKSSRQKVAGASGLKNVHSKQFLDKNYLLNAIGEMLSASHLNSIVEKSTEIIDHLVAVNDEDLVFNGEPDESPVLRKKTLISQLLQIRESLTLERSKYYVLRLRKSITQVKTSKINDINLNLWKEYDDILTDSLWIFDKRDNSGSHNAGYWGNFIPQIPNQFIRRYTKKNEWVLDPFLGSGTTLMECKRLGRNGVGIELSPRVAEIAKTNIDRDGTRSGNRADILVGDSGNPDVIQEIKGRGINSVQMIIMHPPYWDIIKFSKDRKDLSDAESVESFLQMFGDIVENTARLLDGGRYLVLVIGDKYAGGEWIPLGFYAMNEVMKRGYGLKSIVVKNFNITKGKRVQEDLWRYRALVGGFYVFKHEYIFLFQKEFHKARRNSGSLKTR